MKRKVRFSPLLCLAAALFIIVKLTHSHEQASLRPHFAAQPVVNRTDSARVLAAYGQLPLDFEENRGQTDARVNFMARGNGYTVFLTNQDATLRFDGPVNDQNSPQPFNSAPALRTPRRQPSAVVRLALMRSNQHPDIEALEPQSGKSNYLIGDVPSKWHRDVPRYARVKYHGVYPGVDLIYYGNQGRLESDYLVAPGANPHQITLLVQGAQHLKLQSHGDLLITTSLGDVVLRRPVAFQLSRLGRREVAASYVRRADNVIGIQLGPYDAAQSLVIDPVLAYATYLGGTANQTLYSIAADSNGFAYVTGFTSSTNFPVTTGSWNTTFPAGATAAAFVTKLKQDGSGLVYSTFLGGTAAVSISPPVSIARSIAVDASGDAYIAGTTTTSDFPTFNPYQSTNRGGGGFITELDPAGQNLLYSTYLSGTGTDAPSSIAIDANGNAYIAGETTSKDFPVISGTAVQTTNKSTGQFGTAFLSRIDTSKAGASTLLYSTYLGGTGQEAASGVAVDANANAYVTGTTNSTDFPGPAGGSPNGFQANLKNTNGAAFVARINTGQANALTYSTYLSGTPSGSSNPDGGGAIALGPTGDAYITGVSYTTDFPTVGAIDTASNTPLPKIIIARVDTTKSGAASLIYSTYFGGTKNSVGGTTHGSDIGYSIKIDSIGNIYVTGSTTSIDFPVTPSAPQSSRIGTQNAFMSELNPAGSKVLFSTYLGGSSETGYSLALDGASPANVYITGNTSGGFPVTAGAFQTTDNVIGTINADGFVAKLSPPTGPGVSVTPAALNFANQVINTMSSPLTVTLGNISSGSLTMTSPGITISGSNASDFAISNNTCPAVGGTLAAAASCTVSVTFKPSTASNESATLSFTDNDVSSPQQVPLSGTGATAPPAVSVSPTSLTFGSQNLNTTSTAKTVTLTNSGNTAVTINGAGVSIVGTNVSDFAQTNTCPAVGSTLAAGANCTISVTFKPTAVGARSATLNIADSDSSSPQQVTLSGTGSSSTPDFSVAVVPSSLSVAAGSSASFSVTATSLGGFSAAVALTCAGAPKDAKCTLTPASVTPAANASTSSNGTLVTTKRTMALPQLRFQLNRHRPNGSHAWWLLCTLLTLLAVWLHASRQRARKLAWTFALALALSQTSCSGLPHPGTPVGSYSLTITATSGTFTHTTTVTLTVS
jgi:hypothetical protein